MIHRPLAAVTEADLVTLIEQAIPEGRSLEYKRDLPADTRDAKAEFLADLSSFANTSGGDLIFGFEESAGVPTALLGVDVDDPDALGLRFENMCRDNIEPRIQGLQIRCIPLSSGRYAVMVRIGLSWQAPHRIRQTSVFAARNSRGKYPMDVAELRTAFLNAASLETRVRMFREQRLKRIETNDLPRPLIDGIRICLHLIPIESVFGDRRLDLNSQHEVLYEFRPMGQFHGLNASVNIDGAVAYTSSEFSYTQLFRSGQVEAVMVYPPVSEHQKALWSPFETEVRKACSTYLAKLRELEFVGPVAVMLTIVNAAGSYLHTGSMSMYGAKLLNLDVIQTPDFVVEDDNSVDNGLTELFEVVWNAYGKVRPKDFNPG